MKKLTLLFTLCLSLTVGCVDKPEGENLVPLQPATGTLTIGGQPKGGVTVGLIPDDAAKQAATAVTADDGTFTLKTGAREGAEIGAYKVVLSYDPAPSQDAYKGSGPPKAPEAPFPKEWTSVATSPQIVDIKAGDNKVEIKVP